MVAGLMALGALACYPLIAIAIGIWAGLRAKERSWIRFFVTTSLGASLVVSATAFGLGWIDWKMRDNDVLREIAQGKILSEGTSGARTFYIVELTHPVHGWKGTMKIERKHFTMMPFVPTVRWGAILGCALAALASFSRAIAYALRNRRNKRLSLEASGT